MRVGPLSNHKVIKFIHEHFVPVYIANEDYASGKFGKAGQKLVRAIRDNAREKGELAGSVQLFLLTADLEVHDTLAVSKAYDLKQLMPFLRQNVKKLGVTPQRQLIPARPQNPKPCVDNKELVLRLDAQYRPRLKMSVSDWVVLGQDEWQQFLPPSNGNTEWQIKDDVVKKLVIRLYPYAQNWDHNLDQISIARMTAEVIEVTDEATIVSLRGKMEMIHTLYVRTGQSTVSSDLTGYVTIKPGQKPKIKLITAGARFADRPFEGLLQTQ